MKLAKHQQEVVCRMRQLGWITPAEEAAAREEKSNLAGLNRFKAASPYVTNAASQELMKRFGRDAVIKGGMRFKPLMMPRCSAWRRNGERWHGRLRGRGTLPTKSPFAIDPRTHFVKAIVGGVDTKKVSSIVRLKPIVSLALPLSRLSTTRLLLRVSIRQLIVRRSCKISRW